MSRVDNTGALFEERLSREGNVFSLMVTAGTGLGADKDFYYRWTHTRLEISVAASFDKWANSVDFVLNTYIDFVDIAAVRLVCGRKLAAGQYDQDIPLRLDITQEYEGVVQGRLDTQGPI